MSSNKLTKRMKIIRKSIDYKKQYSFKEAVFLLKDLKLSTFIESVDVSIKLGSEIKKNNKSFCSSIIFPHKIIKNIKLAVFTKDINIITSVKRNFGISLVVGMDDLAEKIRIEGSHIFNKIIVTNEAKYIFETIKNVVDIEKIIFNVKNEQLYYDIQKLIQEDIILNEKINYCSDKGGIINMSIGTIIFECEKLQDNIEFLLKDIIKSKTFKIKKKIIQKICLSTTMGPGLRIDENSLFT